MTAALEEYLDRNLRAFGAAGYQIASSGIAGSPTISLAGGFDLAHRSVDPTSLTPLYCLAKPVFAAAIVLDPPSHGILGEPLTALLPVVPRDLTDCTGWDLLNHRASLARSPIEFFVMLPSPLRTELALDLRSDRGSRPPGHGRYSDAQGWLVVDHILKTHLGYGILSLSRREFARAGLLFPEGEVGKPDDVVLVDGVIEAPRRMSFACLSTPEYFADGLVSMSALGCAGTVATVYQDLATRIRSSARLRALLVPTDPAGLGFDPDLQQTFGVGTMLGVGGPSLADICGAFIGHTSWGGTGVAWFDPASGAAGCIRLLGLDRSGAAAFRFRLRPILKEVLRATTATS